MRTRMEWERAANKLPARNIAFAARSADFLPMTSDSFAQSGVEAVLARLYADPTQVYCAEVACKLLAMVGSAVATIVISIAARNCDKQSESMTSLLRVDPIVFVTFSDMFVCTRCSSRSCWSSLRSSIVVAWLVEFMASAEEQTDRHRGHRQQGHVCCTRRHTTARHV